MTKWVGRLPKYNSPEEMQLVINKYFKECEETGEVPTVTGLCYVLGLDRKCLQSYENMLENDRFKRFDNTVKAEFVNSIKGAKRYIENCYEQALFNKNSTVGAIFTLKNNYGYVDKTEQVVENKTISVELDDE